MQSEVRVRISKKLAIHIPMALAEAVGIKEGSHVKLEGRGFPDNR